jgi:hypothetical protein
MLDRTSLHHDFYENPPSVFCFVCSVSQLGFGSITYIMYEVTFHESISSCLTNGV